MRIEQSQWQQVDGWRPAPTGQMSDSADVVFVFCSRTVLDDTAPLHRLAEAYPSAQLFGCSTAGEIAGTQVQDGSVAATAVSFASTDARLSVSRLEHAADSYPVGERLGQTLAEKSLAHVLLLSKGLDVNGSELVRGCDDALPEGVQVTGGLAADGDRFQETFVIDGRSPRPDSVAALGLYGDQLGIGHGSLGGWDPFGPERLITDSAGNVLKELDGRSALSLYRQYLGPHADELPASGLLFPLSVRRPEGTARSGVVRTVLGIDPEAGTMTFAGDVPQGHYAQFMKANFDRLIDGASQAAKGSFDSLGEGEPELGLLISCVGRKMVLKQRVEEEVEAVREVLGPQATLTGFYSYGEISPFVSSARCELHNQTMTITTLTEKHA